MNIKSALQAALFASLLWELAKHLFAWYVVHLAETSIFYGALSTLVIFVLWVYYSSTILLVGGAFAYFLEEDQQKINGLTRSKKKGDLGVHETTDRFSILLLRSLAVCLIFFREVPDERS